MFASLCFFFFFFFLKKISRSLIHSRALATEKEHREQFQSAQKKKKLSKSQLKRLHKVLESK